VLTPAVAGVICGRVIMRNDRQFTRAFSMEILEAREAPPLQR
jgi:hypothetical protein